jgi:hypothetical protein
MTLTPHSSLCAPKKNLDGTVESGVWMAKVLFVHGCWVPESPPQAHVHCVWTQPIMITGHSALHPQDYQRQWSVDRWNWLAASSEFACRNLISPERTPASKTESMYLLTAVKTPKDFNVVTGHPFQWCGYARSVWRGIAAWSWRIGLVPEFSW